jgi:3-dehydroquinate dehydratase type I
MICISILSRNVKEAIEKIRRAEMQADILEVRLDVMDSFDLKEIKRAASKPIIITYRSKKEGGNGTADYGTRIRYLSKALEAGVDYVDVEYSLPLEFRQKIFQSQGDSRIIVSTHVMNQTPSREELQSAFKKMVSTGADIVKIVTRARKAEDNLRILQLIPTAQELGVKIIAFCMGPLGRISRIATIYLGGYLTFASLERGEEAADGQIPAHEMKNIFDLLGT